MVEKRGFGQRRVQAVRLTKEGNFKSSGQAAERNLAYRMMLRR